MRSINQLMITGRAGRDAEHRSTPSGQDVVNVSIAYTERRQDADGQWVDGDTTWLDVAVWDRRAQEIARNIRKGDLVLVVGAVKLREYERRDGTAGASIAVTAQHIGLSLQPQGQGQPAQAGDSWNSSGQATQGFDTEPPW
ncbi:hypothetical protein CJ204_00855 [Corynebacterium xerosis]|uniref:Single-stranded DNA-binding protein n=1 Tax=Corynebacterium xerosis TaxID=1725 RepID=A0A2N6T258_9CORY|nr:single-stranded DNA-binding protein [Corynebacterium xerosis]PMC63401.1 hypothetical protein CJ204_00855 [Corynebacterium xerosis]